VDTHLFNTPRDAVDAEGKVRLSGQGGGGLDKVLIIQMLLEHEKQLKMLEDEMKRVREYLTDIDALREQLYDWLKLTEKLERIQPLMGPELQDNR